MPTFYRFANTPSDVCYEISSDDASYVGRLATEQERRDYIMRVGRRHSAQPVTGHAMEALQLLRTEVARLYAVDKAGAEEVMAEVAAFETDWRENHEGST